MLSLIVPAYNEEDNILPLYQEVRRVLEETGIPFELLYVDDGSQDMTLDQIKALAQQDQRVKYITFSRNFGKESSMLAGLQWSRGQAVVLMDADLQHPPSLLPAMYAYYQEGYDQVIARRNRQGDAKAKSFLAQTYYKLVNRLTDVDMLDGAGDFRMLSRRAVDALLQMGEYNRFSKGLFAWIGFKEKIIPYDNQQRHAGTTKFSLKKLLNYGIQGILSFNDKPLRVCFQLGLLCIAISLLYILWTFMMILKDGIAVGGYFTTISAILIIGGVQLLSIGVLGEYIGKIYYEVKKRPHYLIREDNLEGPKRPTLQAKRAEASLINGEEQQTKASLLNGEKQEEKASLLNVEEQQEQAVTKESTEKE